MSIFSKDLITNPELDWFKIKLDDNFRIDNDGHSKVVFGFNGVGKSTIFKCIKQLNNSEVEYLEYIELKDQIVKGKDKLIISSNISQIEQLKKQKEPLVADLNIKKLIKDTYGYSKIGEVDQFGERVKDAVRNNSFNGFTKTHDDIRAVETILSNVPAGLFINAIPEISRVISAEQELQNEKDRVLFNVLSTLNEVTVETDNVCPVCDSNITNIKSIIQNKMHALSERKSELVIKLKKSNLRVDESVISNLVTALSKLNDDPDLKSDFVLCGGSSTKLASLNATFSAAQSIDAQLQPLEIEAERVFNNLSNIRVSLEQDLKRYYQVTSENITFDDSNHSVTVKFPRELKTYSTGELNLISFLFRMYSFIGSDKSLLILDDPVSSLDLVNHYKIAYEIVKNNKRDKKLLILTHSVEFVNVVNSQHPNSFKFYYLEEANGRIFLQSIGYDSSDPNPNIISLHRLQDQPPFDRLIESLRSRESQTEVSSIQRLFHFTIDKQHLNGDTSLFSNHDLIDLIDNFREFTNNDFYTNSFKKVLHLVALRTWLECKLFYLIPNEQNHIKDQYLQKDTFHKKIDYLFPRLQVPLISVPENISRDLLMSKKVMLNQSIHYESQIMPFAYAINISLDDLKNEILELKSLFS